MIGGLIALLILSLQVYHLAPVEEGKQLIAVSIFNQEYIFPWTIVFLFDFICIISSLLVVLRMNVNHRFVDGESFPLAIFMLVAISSFPAIFIQPELLLVSLLGILIVYLLLNIYNKNSIVGIIFQTSFLCSIATLFYAPSIIFLLVILIGVSIFRPFNIRNLIIICIGFLLLYLYLFGLSYIFGWDINLFLNLKLELAKALEIPLNIEKIGLGIVFLILIISISSVYAKRQRLIVRQRNQLSVLFAAILLCLIVGLIFNFTGSFLFIFSLSGIFFLFFYKNINKKWLVEVPLIVLLIYNTFVSIYS